MRCPPRRFGHIVRFQGQEINPFEMSIVQPRMVLVSFAGPVAVRSLGGIRAMEVKQLKRHTTAREIRQKSRTHIIGLLTAY
jgi:hypothetical protein